MRRHCTTAEALAAQRYRRERLRAVVAACRSGDWTSARLWIGWTYAELPRKHKRHGKHRYRRYA